MMTARLILPAIGNDDRIPNDKAVWREGNPPLGDKSRPVSVEYEGGIIARTYVGSVPDRSGVVRWRWGWSPK